MSEWMDGAVVGTNGRRLKTDGGRTTSLAVWPSHLEPCAFISAGGGGRAVVRHAATPLRTTTRSEAVSGKGRREVVAVVAVVRSCVHVGADTALITPEIS